MRDVTLDGAWYVKNLTILVAMLCCMRRVAVHNGQAQFSSPSQPSMNDRLTSCRSASYKPAAIKYEPRQERLVKRFWSREARQAKS